jgi:hypothetical protein
VKRLIVLLALTALVLPASSSAATRYYVGKTEQGYRASAKVVDGDLKWIKLRWWVDCKDSDYTYGPFNDGWYDLPQGPIEQTGTRFTDAGSGEADLEKPKGHKVRYSLSLAGELHKGGVIKATHGVEARFLNSKGKQYDVCRGSIDMRLKKR